MNWTTAASANGLPSMHISGRRPRPGVGGGGRAGPSAGVRHLSAHPGRYVGDEGVLGLQEAVRKMSSAVAVRLGLCDLLRAGHHADVVVFDPTEIRDEATFEDPYRVSVGVRGRVDQRRVRPAGRRPRGHPAASST